MQIATTRFGAIDIADDQLLQFAEGLLGFETITQYVLIDMPGDGPFKWLQAVADPDLAFVVTDPALFWPDFHPEVRTSELKGLGDGETLLIVLVVVPDDPTQATANLFAPLAINPSTRQGKQLILADSNHSMREPLFGQSIQAVGLSGVTGC